MQNPFLLTGGSFLLFYLVFAIAVNLAVRYWIRGQETRDIWHKEQITDPYKIAFLRDGKKEALRIATIALIDRGLLLLDNDKLHTKNSSAVELVSRPIEKAVLKHYGLSGSIGSVYTSAYVTPACEQYQTALEKAGLHADDVVYKQRQTPTTLAIAALLIVALVKITIALSQGRHNLLFLVILTILSSIGVFLCYRKPITGKGEFLLADLKRLFSSLRLRAKTIPAGGQTNEAALLAAIFGISVLPAATFPFINKLYPRTSDSGSGCGSSSDGGSCGGGGCGGGCGG